MRPAWSSPGASDASGLEAAATPAAVAVAAGAEAGEQDEDRGDDGHDDGQAEHDAQPVHDSGEQDRDEDADHGTSPSMGDFHQTPRLGCWPMVSPAPVALIPRLGQERMPLGDRCGDVDDGPVAAAGVVAQTVERLALGHAL